MFHFSNLFYPWGYILQILALVHLVRRRGDYYWYFIILFGGFVGAAAYMLIEIVPDFGLMRYEFQGYSRKKRIRELETKIVDNPAPANYEELAELYWEQKEYAKAREAYNHSISARTDSLHPFYHRALCSLALEDFPGAVEDLEKVVRGDLKFDYYRAQALLAHAYGKTGNAEHAAVVFAGVVQYSTVPETFYNYASLLKSQNRLAEAREWAQKTLDKKRTLPRYVQRRERDWFRKAKALLKELAVPPASKA